MKNEEKKGQGEECRGKFESKEVEVVNIQKMLSWPSVLTRVGIKD